MSLFGTLDTFALPDVLRLLAATSKSGRLDLDLTGASGPGALWLVDGLVAAVAAPGAQPSAPSADVVFELLRRPQGSFTFDADGTSEVEGRAAEVEELLAGAGELLAEWRDIEAVVPSLDVVVRLRGELVGEQVTVSAAQWRLLVGVGSGTTVRGLGAARSLGELAVSRAVKDLFDAGLVEIGPAQVAGEIPSDDVGTAGDAPTPEPSPFALTFGVADAVSDGEWERESRAGAPALRVVREEDAAEPQDEVVPTPNPVTDLLAASLHDLAETPPSSLLPTGSSPEEHGEVADEEAAEVARRLSALGPEGVAAVAAAAEATTSEERDAAMDAIVAEVPGQAVNRSALLKFLSTVRT